MSSAAAGPLDKWATREFTLKHIRAKDAAQILNELLCDPLWIGPVGLGIKRPEPKPTFSLRVDQRTNTLLFRGRPNKLEEAIGLIKKLDTSRTAKILCEWPVRE